MFNSEEILELLQSSPSGYLEPNHVFFKESNSNLFKKYKKLGSISNIEDENFHKPGSSLQNQIFCNAFGCSAAFDSTSSYQSHYNTMHRFICEQCKKSFPTEHFLDLHISERHDSYFMARLERGERMFKCYLEECQEVFGNSHERKEHCLKHHKFPSNFRFDQMIHKKTCLKKHKPSEDRTEQHRMEVDGESISANNKSNKFEISFGKQREKTFCPKKGSSGDRDSGKTLDNMEILNEVLDTI